MIVAVLRYHKGSYFVWQRNMTFQPGTFIGNFVRAKDRWTGECRVTLHRGDGMIDGNPLGIRKVFMLEAMLEEMYYYV